MRRILTVGLIPASSVAMCMGFFRLYWVSVVVVGLACCSGCNWERETRGKIDLGVEALSSPLANSAAYRDTIGSLTYTQGLSGMRVRGYGLVVGLGKNGSADCPRQVRDRLVQDLYKHYNFSSGVVGTRGISPEAMLDDLDTAVVLVQGTIPPAATEGATFDVSVRALPGTRTRSLRGGRLYTSDLELFRAVEGGLQMSGRVLARAQGPVFMNPFADDASATRANPLEGLVLGGGVVREDRRIRFVVGQPSYHWARRIQDRINSFVGGGERVADAVSPSFVQVQIPRAYEKEPAHFLSLMRCLYLPSDDRFAAVRARELAAEIVQPNAPHGMISLCFEGLGRAALPVLNELYVHPKDYVSFHAAVAGLRLGDYLAGDTLVRHAEDVDGAYRFRAIRGLAGAKGMSAAGMCLRRLLDDEDPRIRIAAYEALLERRDPIIETTRVGGDNFMLDLVPSGRSSFVHVKRRGERRIALFGSEIRCAPPVLYRAPDGSLTISAAGGAESLTLLRMVVSSGSMSPPVEGPLELAALIKLMGGDAEVDTFGRITGLGIDYGAVVRALYYLHRDGVIEANFILEEPNASELFGPRQEGRPESEL